jgi:hypothetical protein
MISALEWLILTGSSPCIYSLMMCEWMHDNYIENGICEGYNVNTFWITLLMLFGYAGKARVCGRAFFVETLKEL